ncbi:MAG TPA: translation initiation factor IF-5A [Candidatus Nanoarchaeia archaeon]|nr:translation initiation factor IF-5A [Candidatus Nanoarchaeia archaeon]
MAYKFIEIGDAKIGTIILIEGVACAVKSMDVSKTGKHGHAKVRMEAIGVIDGKKRVIVKPGSEKFGVPMIEKKRGQVLSVSEKSASLMDMESFETIEVPFIEELGGQIKESDQVEYWIMEGEKIIKRIA